MSSLVLRGLIDEVVSIVKPLADKNGNAIEVICPGDVGSFRPDIPSRQSQQTGAARQAGAVLLQSSIITTRLFGSDEISIWKTISTT